MVVAWGSYGQKKTGHHGWVTVVTKVGWEPLHRDWDGVWGLCLVQCCQHLLEDLVFSWSVKHRGCREAELGTGQSRGWGWVSFPPAD